MSLHDALQIGYREVRGALIGAMAGLAADADAQAKVADLFERYRSDPSSVEANVAAVVVRSTAAVAGAAAVDAIIEGFRGGRTPQEELRHLYPPPEVRAPDPTARGLEPPTNPRAGRQQ